MKYNATKNDLMNVAINLQWEFNYFDYKDERKGLQETIDKYEVYKKKIDIFEKMREKISNEIEICQNRMEKNDDKAVFDRLETEIDKFLSIRSLDEMSTENKKFLDSYNNDLTITRLRIPIQYYKSFGVIDGDPKAELVKRINILKNVAYKLFKETRQKRRKINGREPFRTEDINKSEYANKILEKLKSDVQLCQEYLNLIELRNACANEGLKRAFAPGNGNNCILESITSTINSANGIDKENPRKAYQEAAVWQSILRAEAVELGYRENQGFHLVSDPDILRDFALQFIEFKDLTNNKNEKFIKLLRLNLDNYILTIWRHNSEAKKLEVFNEIKGINAEKEGIVPKRINILFSPGHAEPMFEDIDLNLNLSFNQNDIGESSRNNEADKSMEFENVNSSIRGGAQENAQLSRVETIKNACEQSGFTRGNAPGTGNNCFIQSLLMGIHDANGIKVSDPQQAHEEAAVWEAILRDEAVVNGFERTGYLGVSDLTDGTSDKKFREQLVKNLDNYVLKIWRYNEQSGTLQNVDIVNGEKAENGGTPVEINMLFDINHFDPLFTNKNEANRAPGKQNREQDIIQIDNLENLLNDMADGVEGRVYSDMVKKLNEYAENGIFDPKNFKKSKNELDEIENKFESVKSILEICKQNSISEINFYSRLTIANEEKIAGEFYLKFNREYKDNEEIQLFVKQRYKKAEAEYALIEKIGSRLYSEIAMCNNAKAASKRKWSNNILQNFKNVSGKILVKAKINDVIKTLFKNSSPIKQNTIEIQKENPSKIPNTQSVEPDKNEIKNLSDLDKLIKELSNTDEVNIKTEIRDKVNNYYKNGCTEIKSIDDNPNDITIMALLEMSGSLNLRNEKLKRVINELEKSKVKDKIVLLGKLDEKEMLISQVTARMRYEISIRYGKTILRQKLDNEVNSESKEFLKQNNLKQKLVKLAAMEVGEEFIPEVLNSLNDYIQKGSINEHMKDWKTAVENLKTMKYYLMEKAAEFVDQFNYYDLNREDLQKTVSQYNGLREKLDLIDRVREKINSEIDICHEHVPLESDAYAKLKIEVEKWKSEESFDENYINKLIGTGFRNERMADKYYYYIDKMDGDLNVNWEEKIKVLNYIKLELDNINDDQKSKLRDAIRDKVNQEINNCEKYQEKLDLYNACANKGLKRGFTPGSNNNCVLESITKVISRANGSEKADPLKAYEEMAAWQSTLRMLADESGIRNRDGILMRSKIKEDIEFTKKMKENLDGYILTEWKYDSKEKQLKIVNEIKGKNANKNSVRINVLDNPGHMEPLFTIDEIGQNINLEPAKISKTGKIKSKFKKLKNTTKKSNFDKLFVKLLWKVKKVSLSIFPEKNANDNINNIKQSDMQSVETGNNKIKNLSDLKELAEELLQIENMEVTPELKEKVENYFKNGIKDEVGNNNAKMYKTLQGMYGPLFKIAKDIHHEKLDLYSQDINDPEIFEKLEEKYMLLFKTCARISYEKDLYNGKMIREDIDDRVYIKNTKFTNQKKLKDQIGKLAEMEVGEELSPKMLNGLNYYIQNGSIKENMDWKTSYENLKTLKYYLMESAINFNDQFEYYDINRSDIQKTLSKYKGFKEKHRPLSKEQE